MFKTCSHIQQMFVFFQKDHVVKRCLIFLKKTVPISSDVRLFPKMNEILQNSSYFFKLFGVSKIIRVSKNIRKFININLKFEKLHKNKKLESDASTYS